MSLRSFCLSVSLIIVTIVVVAVFLFVFVCFLFCCCGIFFVCFLQGKDGIATCFTFTAKCAAVIC